MLCLMPADATRCDISLPLRSTSVVPEITPRHLDHASEVAFRVQRGGVMPIPTNTVDSLIAAAKRELDAARRDGDATLIASALLRPNGRLDRKLELRAQGDE